MSQVHKVFSSVWFNAFWLSAVLGLAIVNDHNPQLYPGDRADLIVIDKATRQLTLFDEDCSIYAVFPVSFGKTQGRKEKEGDNKTPEGVYRVTAHEPDSAFHKALRLNYPSAADTIAGRTGSDIMIHGLPNGLRLIGTMQGWTDWSAGSITLRNEDLDEIYGAVADGVEVRIGSGLSCTQKRESREDDV